MFINVLKYTTTIMIIKFMGVIDVLIAITLFLIPFNVISWKIVLLSTTYLLTKAYMFKGDFASFLDGVSGVYLLIAFIGISTFFSPIFGIYLLQKAAYSLF